jgi:hypothetical protein
MDTALIAGILIVQPAIALLYLYLGIRLLLWYGFSRSGDWIDNRVTHATEAIKHE